jgi:hypothetical protein
MKHNWPSGKWQPVAGRVFVDEEIAIALLEALQEVAELGAMDKHGFSYTSRLRNADELAAKVRKAITKATGE